MEGRTGVLDEIHQLLEQRKGLYAQADLHLHTEEKGISVMVEEIVQFYQAG